MTPAGWGLLVLVALSTWDEGGAAPSGLLAWHALLVVLLLAAILFPRRTTRGLGIGSPILAWAVVYAAVWLAGAIRAPYGFAAWLQGVEVLAVAGVVWLASRSGSALLARAAIVLGLVGAVQAGLVLFQRLALAIDRPAGTFLNPNHLAAWLGAVLLLGGSQLLGARLSRARAMASAALVVTVIAAIGVTGSRGALVGLIAGTATLVALAWPSVSGTYRRLLVLSAVAVVVAVSLGLAHRLSSGETFRHQRWNIWGATVRLIASHPWTGSGPGQFRFLAREFQFADGDGPLEFDRVFATPHSDLLRLPGELGLPGLLAAAGLALALARHVHDRRRAHELPPGAGGAVSAVVALGVHAWLDDLSTRPALYVLAAALVGSLLALPRSAPRVGHAWRGAAAVVLLLAFLVGDVAPYASWRMLRGVPRGRLAGEDMARLDRALRWNRLHPDLWRRRAEHLAGSGEWNPEDYAGAREAAERAVRLASNVAEYHLGLARIEARACRNLFAGDVPTSHRATEGYANARRLDPFNATIPLEEAEAALACGDPRAATRAAESALELEPRSVAPRLALAAALLARAAPAGREQAERLLLEAEREAVASRGWLETSPYARRLLQAEPGAVARIRGLLQASAAR